MDSAKPGVYIPAARMVDPNVYLRSLSGSSSTGSIPIRAPVTVDDDESDVEVYNSDFEFNGPKSVSHDSNTSSYSSEVEFGTEEEEFESASAGLDDEVGEISAALNRNNFYRLSGDNAAGGNAVLGGLRVSKSFLDDMDEGTSGSCYASFSEEEDIPNPRVVVPRANLSMDDDEIDHILDGEGEDSGFPDQVKIPGTSETDVEFLGSESETSCIGEPEFVGLVLDESVSGEEEKVDANDSNDGSVLIKSIEENGLNVEPEVHLLSPASSRCQEEFEKERLGEDKSFDGCVGSPVLRNHSDNFETEFDAMKKPDEGIDTTSSHELESVELETRVCQNIDGDVVLNEAENLGKMTEDEIGSGNLEMSHMSPTQDSFGAGTNDVGIADEVLSGLLPGSVDFVEPHPESLLDSESEADQDSGKMAKCLSPSSEDPEKNLVENAIKMTENMEQKSQETMGYEDVLDKTTKDEEEYSELRDSRVVLESEHVETQDSEQLGESLLLSDRGLNNQSLGDSVGKNDETIKFEEKNSGLTSSQVSVYHDSVRPLDYCCGEEESLSSFSEPKGLEDASAEYFTDYISAEKKEDIGKMQPVRMKFLRLVKRLGLSPDDSVVAEAMEKLAKTFHGLGCRFDKAETAELEEEGKHNVEISLNIILLGKTGVGKSAVINSIFCENKSVSGAFEPTTSLIKEINGIVDGIKIRVLDTPGLRPSAAEERFNQRILFSVKKCMRKFPADVFLYIDRLDGLSGGFCDIHLLRAITGSLGSSVWKNTVLVLTHAASIDLGSSYENFIAQRSLHMQRAIRQAIGDSTLANPLPEVVLAENNTESFRENEAREFVFENWRQQLMLICYSVKILSNASSMLKVEGLVDETEAFESRLHSFSVFYQLWNLLNPRAYPKRSFDRKYDTVVIPNASERNNVHFSDSPFEKLSKEGNKSFLDEFVQGEELKRSKVTEINTGKLEKDSLYESIDPGFAEPRNGDDCCIKASHEGINLDVATTVRRVGKGKRRFSINLDSAGCKADLRTPFPVGRSSKRMSLGIRMNKEGKGRICVRLSGSEQIQMVIWGFLPVLVDLFSNVYGGCHKKQLK